MRIAFTGLTVTTLFAIRSVATAQNITSTEFHERLRQRFQPIFDAQAADGGASAWWIGIDDPIHGELYWIFGNSRSSEGSDVADIPATREDHFDIGSVSKTFGATANLLLIERDDFSLNDTVRGLVPEFATQFLEYANYTVAELMSMQTRVPDFVDLPTGIIPLLLQDPSLRFTIPEIVETTIRYNPVPLDPDCPGCGQYSTTNTIMLEYIAEAITGVDMPQLVAELVTGPLGLTSTAEPHRNSSGLSRPDPAATPYAGSGCAAALGLSQGQDITDLAGAYVNTGTGGGMYSNIDDLLQWAKSGTGDSLLSAATVEARHDYQPLSPLNIPYGLGQFVLPEDSGLPDFTSGFYGHDGDTIGFSTWAFKNDELGISFASNLNTCGSFIPFVEALGVFVEEFAALTNGNNTTTAETNNATVSPTASPTLSPSYPTSIPSRTKAPAADMSSAAAECMFFRSKYKYMNSALSLTVLLQYLW